MKTLESEGELSKRIQSPGLSLVFGEDEIRTARADGKLLSLDIQLTKRCNLRCLYCYAVSAESQKNELGLDEVIHVIDEARELGLRTLTLTGGEPLIDETYFQIAEYARQCGICVLLFTNGLLVSREVAMRLMELRISPCVKLDSLSSMTQDYLAGERGALERIKEGIGNLIAAGYTTKYSALSVNAVICRYNLDQIPELWTWARRQKIVPSVTRLQLMGRARGKTDLMVTPKELYELYGKICEIDKGFGILWKPNIPWPHGKPCRRHYVGCFIDSEGYVQPCSGVPIKAGNIREQSLRKILSTAEIFKIARNMESYIEGACRNCEFHAECYGCRSIAYFMGNSFTAEDPLCWNRWEREVG